MRAVPLAAILAVGWIAITGGFSLANLLLGAVIASAVIFLLRYQPGSRSPVLRRILAGVALLLLFLRELLLSALNVARLAVLPDLKSRLKPAIVAFPLTVTTDIQITLLANLITLTPGTLTMDVSADRRLLYIHVLVLEGRESLVAGIANGFEKKVIDIFR